MMPRPKTIGEALTRMTDAGTTQDERWRMLGILLQEFMLASGLDLDQDIGIEESLKGDEPAT